MALTQQQQPDVDFTFKASAARLAVTWKGRAPAKLCAAASTATAAPLPPRRRCLAHSASPPHATADLTRRRQWRWQE